MSEARFRREDGKAVERAKVMQIEHASVRGADDAVGEDIFIGHVKALEQQSCRRSSKQKRCRGVWNRLPIGKYLTALGSSNEMTPAR